MIAIVKMMKGKAYFTGSIYYSPARGEHVVQDKWRKHLSRKDVWIFLLPKRKLQTELHCEERWASAQAFYKHLPLQRKASELVFPCGWQVSLLGSAQQLKQQESTNLCDGSCFHELPGSGLPGAAPIAASWLFISLRACESVVPAHLSQTLLPPRSFCRGQQCLSLPWQPSKTDRELSTHLLPIQGTILRPACDSER